MRTIGGTPSSEDFYNPRHWLAAMLLSCALLSAGVPLSSAAGKDRPHTPQNAAKPNAKRELLPAPDITANAWGLAGAPDSVKSDSVKCDLPGISQARRITITKPTPAAYWQIQLAQDTPAALAGNTTLRLHFWARSKTKNSMYAVYEHNTAPNEKYLNLMLVLTPEWKEYSLVLTTPREIPAGFTGVRFQCGLKEGEIEIAGTGLEDWGINPMPMPLASGIDVWGGQAHNEGWRRAANARIDTIRKGNLEILVLDADGRPVPNAYVEIAQKSSKFRFGTAVAGYALFDNGPDGAKYREILLRDFNCVVLENELKWTGPDEERFPAADRMLAWFGERHIPVRGHNLFWPSRKWMPDYVKDLHGDALKKAVHDHVSDYVARTRGRVYVWDVINEAVVNHEATDEMGGDKVRAEVYQWAHQADPNVLLAYNDYDVLNNHAGANDAHSKEVFAAIRQMQKDGAPITSLGEQAHISLPLTPAPKLLSLLDGWGQFNLPVEITEYDFATHDDALQAEYTDEFLTAVFSHPAVHSFLMWGFWEGAHWLGSEGGAMVNRNWTPRPAAKVYEDLVLHKWRTNATLQTDAKGESRLRAFLGTHEITATKNGRTGTATVQVERSGIAITTVTVRLN